MSNKSQTSTSYKIISICLVLVISAAAYLFQVQQGVSVQQKITKQSNEENGGILGIELIDFKVGVIEAVGANGAEDNANKGALKKLEGILDEALPYTVTLLSFYDYSELVTALDYGKVQLAFLGPSSYVVAHERSGAQAIASLNVDGQAEHYSYLITHVDSPWNSLKEFLHENLFEHSVALNDPLSISGALVPLNEFKKRGVYTDLETHSFKEIAVTGSQDSTGRAVEQKEVEAGLIDSVYYKLLLDQGYLNENLTKVIWQSEPLYHNPWAVSYQVDGKTIGLLQSILTQIDDVEILTFFGADGFVSVSDESYDFVREIMSEVE